MHPFRRASFGREVHTQVVDPTEPPYFDVWDVLGLPCRPRPKECTHAAQLPAKSSRCWYDLSASVMVSRPDVEVYHASPDADRASPTRNGVSPVPRFPRGTVTGSSPMHGRRCSRMPPFRPCAPRTDNPLCSPGGWHSSRSCHAPNGSPLARRQTPCAVASPGHMCCVWN
jgi:hypothetical protein